MTGAVASGGVAGVDGASRRWQRPFSRSGLGLGCQWGTSCAACLVPRAPAPTFLFIALCDGGPPTISGWAPPIRAREQGPKAVGPNGGRSFLTSYSIAIDTVPPVSSHRTLFIYSTTR
jgi:hypothetical protein